VHKSSITDAFILGYQRSKKTGTAREYGGFLAGKPLRLMSTSEELSQMVLRTLAVDGPMPKNGAEAMFTLYLFEGLENMAMSVLEGLIPHQDNENTVLVINRGAIHLQYNPEGQILSLIDTERSLAFYAVQDCISLPDYEVCTPMRMIINWFLVMTNQTFLHAACVGWQGTGALLVGKSGAGKSTTALQCLIRGLSFLGDDYVAVSASLPHTAHRIYYGCKIMDDALIRMPSLQPYVIPTNKTKEKNVAILDKSYALSMADPTLLLSYILRPVQTHAAKTTFRSVSAMAVLGEFAGSTILQMPGAGATMLRALSTLCQHLQTYDVMMSDDPDEVAGAIQTFLLDGGQCCD